MLDIKPLGIETKRKNELLEAINKYNIGGVIIMKGDYETAMTWIDEFQSSAKIPLFMSIDGEWGINMRIENTVKFPYQLTLGAIKDNTKIYEMGRAVARECKALGIHIDFAPDIDVNTNSNNPVINYRSFGENKIKVMEKGLKYAKGLQAEGVMACLKHFPGHGDTDKDSHKDLPTINKDVSTLENLELFPFRKLIKESIWSVMVGHLNVPSMDNTGVPSSLSRKIITDYLKGDMQFQGLVFSDALNMKGASRNMAPGEVELKAYIAGNDILVFASQLDLGIAKIEEYISTDEEKFNEFHERVRKILLFKHKMGLCNRNASSYNLDYNTSTSANPNYLLCQDLYNEAVTMVAAEPKILEELNKSKNDNLFVSVGSVALNDLKTTLSNQYNYTTINIPREANYEMYQSVLDIAHNYKRVVLAYHDMSQAAANSYGLNYLQKDFVERISQHPSVLHVWFGNPYALKYFNYAKNVLVAYEDNAFTHQSVLNILTKNEKPKGSLPISIGRFKEGFNLHTKIDTSFMKDLRPTQEELTPIAYSEEKIKAIDQFIAQMIADEATPGCQVFVMHRGKTIYNKSFGHQTYEPLSSEVNENTMYDLASLTKILSTTLVAMRLKDLNMMRVYGQVKDYLALDSSSTIREIYISQLMTHQAGFIPFIPFYERFNSDNFFQYFSVNPTPTYGTKVAENLYIRNDFKDEMWYEMSHSKLNESKSYLYSDLSMYTMQKILESISKTTLDTFVDLAFYKPMNLRLTYNPSQKYSISEIAPTEYDEKFRKQLIKGYVHDQGAALYGGVAGHAGLFGSAKDVATIMQMLIDRGVWNGKRFFSEETIQQFTSYQSPNSRRGLGFDKPDPNDVSKSPLAPEASPSTFGHTGFTGTCAWADPENRLVFVFLSNRVHPRADNQKLSNGSYRKKIHSMFYDLIHQQ
jgi:beta-glucosidase-like glycosyl hydrolase/CubicO group peptidase (beta-lactamase class C family)